MKTLICLIFIVLFGVLKTNGDDISSIRDVLKSHVHGLVLYVQLGIFGNCNPYNFENRVFQEADDKYTEFTKCYSADINLLADKYDPTIKEFSTESVKNAKNYPNFICELYYYTLDCMHSFIPYMSLCQDAKSNITSYKMYEAVKHIVDYECENEAAVYQVMHQYRYDRCFIAMTRGIDEKLLEVIKIDEDKLLSTSASCSILNELITKAQANELNLCNDKIKEIVTSGFKKFWKSFQCEKSL